MFKQRKHKRFNYIPRHLRDSKYRDDDIKTQWKSVRGEGNQKRKGSVPFLRLLVILGMIIALWFVLTHYEIS